MHTLTGCDLFYKKPHSQNLMCHIDNINKYYYWSRPYYTTAFN